MRNASLLAILLALLAGGAVLTPAACQFPPDFKVVESGRRRLVLPFGTQVIRKDARYA
jgi:hypothetical protein